MNGEKIPSFLVGLATEKEGGGGESLILIRFPQFQEAN